MQNMNKVKLLVVTMFCNMLLPTHLAQTVNQVRIIKNKPNVYLCLNTAERLPEILNQDLIPLKLHNNTRWKIHYLSLLGKSKPSEINMKYGVLDKNRCQLPIPQQGDVFVDKELASGESVDFSVLREHISEGFNVYVEFYYEWEDINAQFTAGDEPQHRILFSSYKLKDEFYRCGDIK